MLLDGAHLPWGIEHSVYQFNENDTPEQKKAQALKGMEAMGGRLPKRIAERHQGGTGACDIASQAINLVIAHAKLVRLQRSQVT
jgi:hypothetical protein